MQSGSELLADAQVAPLPDRQVAQHHVTDADALEVVRPTGIGVAASDRVSADYRVDGPEEVAMLLAALDAELHC